MAFNAADNTNGPTGDLLPLGPEVGTLYIRDNGDVLFIVDIDVYEPSAEDFARAHPHASNVSQRDGFSVVLRGLDYSDGVEVFEGGVSRHRLTKSFRQDFQYRLELWLGGDGDPWREWEVGNEPVKPPTPEPVWPNCGCTKCDVHALDVEF